MTLTYSEIMIRYGELSTKGKNRMRFINKLRNNIQSKLGGTKRQTTNYKMNRVI